MPGGLELSGRQSVFFLPTDPRDENYQDPENIDYSVPRRARYMQNSWKRHQDYRYSGLILIMESSKKD